MKCVCVGVGDVLLQQFEPLPSRMAAQKVRHVASTTTTNEIPCPLYARNTLCVVPQQVNTHTCRQYRHAAAIEESPRYTGLVC